MKKFKLVIPFLTLILASACSKTNIRDNSTAVKEVLEAKDQVLQKSMFRLLTIQEKSEVWQSKFMNYLEKNKLNEQQRIFVVEISKIIKPELFDYSNHSYRKSTGESSIRKRTAELFGSEESYNLLATLSILKKTTPDIIGVRTGPFGNCSCSQTSDWCHDVLTCRSFICKTTSGGCGTFWGYNCDGKCL